jgi:hypothetical protein
MSAPILGFAGFGEAGSRIAAGLREAGAGERMRRRADRENGPRN